MSTIVRHITLLAFIIIILATACKGPKNIESAAAKPKPEWVNDRPLNSSYYIGIGSASKKAEPLEYAAVAKKNAMNDLASEIRVTVKSESFLNTMQVNNYVQEEFNSTISTLANEELEGFEIIDVWENGDDYWVYYRLSKSTHAHIKAERKQKAMQSAHDFLLKAQDARANGNVASAYDLYMHGLFEMKDYWNDVNVWEDGTYLDNTLYKEMREMVSNVRFETADNEIFLNPGNSFKKEVKISATSGGKAATNLPVSISFDNGKFRNVQFLSTDQQGNVMVRIADANLKNTANVLTVQVDLDKLRPSDLDRKLVDGLMESVNANRKSIPIRATLPIVAFKVSEKNFNQTLTSQRLADPLRKVFSDEGFTFSENVSKADYVITIDANTREGGTSSGFHVAYLDVNWSLTAKSGSVLLQNSESNIKGLQLNFEAAGLDAYRKGSLQMEKEVSKKILEAIF